MKQNRFARGMRRLAPSLMLAALLPCATPQGFTAAAQDGADRPILPEVPPRQGRPNIIIILADDMGYSDLGYFGSGIRTPNLDRLARSGLIFSQFYNEAKCTQSRSSLMTGRTSRAVIERDSPGMNGDGRLALGLPTIAELMRKQGYATFISGKWHLGEEPEYWPNRRGFDHSFSLITGASSYFEMRMRQVQDDPVESKHWPSKPFMVKDGQRWQLPPSGFYMTDAIGDEARQMLANQHRTSPDQPFFLYLAFTAPHFPLHALPEDIARYKGRFDTGWAVWRARRLAAMKRNGLLPASAKLAAVPPSIPDWSSQKDQDQWARRMEVFAAQLDRLDQNVGKLLAQLKAQGTLDNTLILFLSDNGAVSLSPQEMARQFGYVVPGAVIGSPESNTVYGEPWAAVSNTPLRNYKQSLFEGGIRTPLIAYWPAGLRRKGRTDVPGQIADILPTALSLAGARSVPSAVTGENLAPLLAGRPVEPRPLFWAFHGYRAMRDGNWKLVSADKGMHWQLFDIAVDPGENVDLANRNPDRLKTMVAAWNQWAAAAGKPYGTTKGADK